MSDWQGQPPPGSQGGPPHQGPPQGQAPMPGGQWGAPHLAAQAGVVRVGDLLQTGARIVGGNLGAFFTVAFMATLPGLAITQFFTMRWQEKMFAQADMIGSARLGGAPNIGNMFRDILDPTDFGGICLGSLIQFVLVYLAQAILMYTVVETLAGRKPPMGQAISKGLARAPAVLVTALLITLAYIAAMLPGFILGILIFVGAAAGDAGAVAACCGMPTMFLLILIPIVYLAVVFFLAVPASVAENAGPVEAISRSIALTKGNRLTIFLTLLCLMLVLFVFACIGGMFGAAFGAGGVDMATGMPQPPSTASQVVSFIMNLLVGSLQTMLLASLAAVAYARIRGIRDGVDAGALAEVFR